MRKFRHIVLFASAILFVISAYFMSAVARDDYALVAAFGIFFAGPVSLLALAGFASGVQSVFDDVVYKKIKPVIIVLAMIQLVLMCVYMVLLSIPV